MVFSPPRYAVNANKRVACAIRRGQGQVASGIASRIRLNDLVGLMISRVLMIAEFGLDLNLNEVRIVVDVYYIRCRS